MSILIIGGDRLGQIPECLRHRGFREIEHVSGRKARDGRVVISSRHDRVLVLTDFVNHSLVGIIKAQAKRSGRPVIFSRRAWSDITRALDSMGVPRC